MTHAVTFESLPAAAAHTTRARLAGMLAVFFLVSIGCPVARAQSMLSVVAVDPASGGPGTVVDFFGQGLDGQADEYLAWVRTPAAGFAFETVAVQNGVLFAVVGPVAEFDSGVVEVWRGRGHPVADRTLLAGGRLLTGFESRVFVAHEAVSGPQFSGFDDPSETLGSSIHDAWLDIDFDPPFVPPGKRVPMIRLTVVIETKSGCSDQTASDAVAIRTLAGPRWSFDITIEADTPFASGAELAAGVATMLNRQFSDLGLIASAIGGVLRICSNPCLQFGFATAVLLDGTSPGLAPPLP